MKRSINVVSRSDAKKVSRSVTGGGKSKASSGDAGAFICGTIGAILFLLFGH